MLQVYLVLTWGRHRSPKSGLSSRASAPVHGEPVCSFFPCSNEHLCLPEDREETIKGFIVNGVERKEAKIIEINRYELQRHLRGWYRGLAMPLQLGAHRAQGNEPC